MTPCVAPYVLAEPAIGLTSLGTHKMVFPAVPTDRRPRIAHPESRSLAPGKFVPAGAPSGDAAGWGSEAGGPAGE